MNNIIVSGCSYSSNTGVTPYSELLNDCIDLNVINKAWPGQSNKSIIREIRNHINDGISDTIFICQLTHLHRLNLYCTLNNRYIDFQPMFINSTPLIKNDKIVFDVDYENIHSGKLKGIVSNGVSNIDEFNINNEYYDELHTFYKQYLKFFYDDTESFYELVNQIDDLNRLVNTTSNKIIFLYWSHVIGDTIELKNRNFLNFDNEYSLLNWSTRNDMLDGRTSHLSEKGHYTLCEKLKLEIDKII